MKWVLISNPYSSILSYLTGKFESPGSPAPRKFLEFLINKSDQILLLIPLKSKNVAYSNNKLPKNLKIIPLRYRLGIRRLPDMFPLIIKLRRVLKEFNPDIIYSTSYYSIPASLVARAYKIPQISRFYGTFLSQLFENKLANIKYFHKLIPEAIAFKLSKDGIILTDDGTKGDYVCEKLRIKKSKLLFIRNGIEKKLIQNIRIRNKEEIRKRLNVNLNDFLITNVSRLTAWKRVDLVILAFDKALNSLPQDIRTKLKLLIVGSGSCERFLKDLANSLSCKNQVYFLGAKDYEETLEIMLVSDIITSFYEVSNVGNVLLEALSLGKVVVARNVGDTNKIIKDGKTGFLVSSEPQKAIYEFSNIVKQVIYNENIISNISMNAQRWADIYLIDWDERLQNEYEWILNKYRESYKFR